MKLNYPATARNRDPLLAVLRPRLPAVGTVLEVASGSGEHAAFFAEALPGLVWQPSSLEAAERASIDAWGAALPNVRPALALDVLGTWPEIEVDAVFCANMIHIAPWPCTPALMAGAVAALVGGGRLLLYGPFRIAGRHTAPSNEAFDASLRSRDPAWGVRDLEAVVDEAERFGLRFEERVEMPANNQVLVFVR